MIIRKKRVNSIDKYLLNLNETKEVYISVIANEENLKLLNLTNCSNEVCIIPDPVGPVTKYNLNGKMLIHKEQEKEPREIPQNYHVIDWHGTDHYGICFRTRMCYPRERILPPLSRIILSNGILRSDLILTENTELLKHVINMFLEIFGYCEVIDKKEKPIEEKIKLKEVKWEILPKGKYPWERAKKILEDYFKNPSCDNKKVLRSNHKTLAQYNPDFLAIGQNSFNGYVVYGYSDREIFIFESNQLGNATYVFNGDWENASQLTKYDIINGKLCYKRLIHSKKWKSNVKMLFE